MSTVFIHGVVRPVLKFLSHFFKSSSWNISTKSNEELHRMKLGLVKFVSSISHYVYSHLQLGKSRKQIFGFAIIIWVIVLHLDLHQCIYYPIWEFFLVRYWFRCFNFWYKFGNVFMIHMLLWISSIKNSCRATTALISTINVNNFNIFTIFT